MKKRQSSAAAVASSGGGSSSSSSNAKGSTAMKPLARSEAVPTIASSSSSSSSSAVAALLSTPRRKALRTLLGACSVPPTSSSDAAAATSRAAVVECGACDELRRFFSVPAVLEKVCCLCSSLPSHTFAPTPTHPTQTLLLGAFLCLDAALSVAVLPLRALLAAASFISRSVPHTHVSPLRSSFCGGFCWMGVGGRSIQNDLVVSFGNWRRCDVRLRSRGSVCEAREVV